MRGQAVDGCIGKDGSHAEMAQSIRDAYARKAEQRALSELLCDDDDDDDEEKPVSAPGEKNTPEAAW